MEYILETNTCGKRHLRVEALKKSHIWKLDEVPQDTQRAIVVADQEGFEAVVKARE